MNIIVNGATRGIGKEVVICLSKDNANSIIATGRNRKSLEELSDQFSNVHGIEVDLGKFDSHSASLKNLILKHFQNIDILVNMAGAMIPRTFIATEDDEARYMMETNFFGPASMIKLVSPFMACGSHIVNISSMGGFQGSSKYKGLSYYSSSKAAIACLSECLAVEFSEAGISVNCLALGAVQTEMLSEAFPGYKAAVDARTMAEFISDFALRGQRFFNGKVIPVAVSNP